MRFRIVLVALVAAVALLASAAPASASREPVPVMGSSDVPHATLAAWYKANKPDGSRCLKPGLTIDKLAKLYVVEGSKENVRGDLAFVQAILETGWFRFGCEGNNFAGIGATDDGAPRAVFSTPRIGVRAQIQHLRAYADPTARKKNLAHECVDPRFHLVRPKGKAPTWNEMGDGNWATDKRYGRKIIKLYNGVRAHTGLASVGNKI